MIGRTISHYKITEKVGGGAMGVVYGAEDLRLNRTVALKFLPTSIEADEDRKRRFLLEAKAASALDHPNICTIHQIDETDDGQMFIVMSHYKGETLKSKIDRGPLPLDDALHFARQTAQGLAKARQAGIVHRDIKPANLIVTTDGVVKILDFGLALLVEETKITMPGSLLGTPAYMSPEQAQGGDVTHRTDIWSLGVVLYEMVSGKRPFKGEYQSAIIYSLLHEPPPPLTDLPAAVSDELNRVINKALAKVSAERYGEVEEMLADLQGVSKLLEGSVSASLAAEQKPPAKKGVLAFAVAAAVVVVLLAAVFYLNRSPQGGAVADNAAVSSPPIAVSPQQTPSQENPAVQAEVPSIESAPKAAPPPEPPSAAPIQAPVARSQPRVETAKAPPVARPSPTAARPVESAKSAATPPPPTRDVPPAAPQREPASPEASTQASTSRPVPVSPATETEPNRPPSELADWVRIRASTDIGVFEEFLRKNPDGTLRVEATNRIEYLKWEAARTGNDPAAARTYLREYPAGRYVDQARALVAPVPVPAPAVVQSRPPAAAPQSNDGEAIRGVIRDFAAAYERRDAQAIAALWPSLKPDQLSSISTSFREARSVRYELKPVSDPEIAGSKATVRYRRSVQFEFASSPPKPVQDDITFSLTKRGASWVIEQVDTR